MGKIKRNKKGQFAKGSQAQKGNVPNPTGKGGFGDHPENMSGGYWKSEDSVSFQYKKLIKLTVSEFKTWEKDNKEEDRTMAQEIAYNAVYKARKDLQYLKELTDRTEGRPSQKVDVTTKGESFNFDDEQVKKIARRVTRGGKIGDISSEKESD